MSLWEAKGKTYLKFFEVLEKQLVASSGKKTILKSITLTFFNNGEFDTGSG
jgi:hypothetical protein